MELLILLFILFIVFLVLENRIHSRQLNKIPLRISVTGTRGKTSIVRILASVFREHGIHVLAKTTGSEAKLIFPDGREELIRRFGITTILEQKKLIRKAVKEEAQCLISEIMSIHPECHSIETRKIIKPHITLISNIRADHIHLAGQSIEELSVYFLNDVYQGSQVFVHQEEVNESLASGVLGKGAELMPVPKGAAQNLKITPSAANQSIPENLDIIYAVSKHFGIEDVTIENGVEHARLDIGSLEIFRLEEGEKEIFFVNAFAANEPESTMKLVNKSLGIIGKNNPVKAGLLALRSDRGERSKQWMEYLVERTDHGFYPLFLTGAHSRILHRKIKGSEIIRGLDAESITRSILSGCDTSTVVFGMGNFHGAGRKMVEYWNEKGTRILKEN